MKYLSVNDYSQLTSVVALEEFVNFLYEHLGQYGDPKEAIEKSIHYAFSKSDGKGGFVMIANNDDTVIGGVVVNKTGMSSYIPENVLVYIAVHRDYRGEGIGSSLLRNAIEQCKRDVALHVEKNNPAKRLYERIGFEPKYIEMRYRKDA